MPSTHGGHCPFPYAVIISVLNLLHHSRTAPEANLVGSSHLNHIFLVFLTRLIVRSNSPLSSHSARKNCSSIAKHHIVNIPVSDKVTYNFVLHTVHLISVGVHRTIFVKLVHLLHSFYACLFSLYGICSIIRSTLSFPTARSIFTLPAVMILKNRPVGYGENAL